MQGVGFRYTVVQAVNALGLTGWVRNEYDGTVTTELQGTEMTETAEAEAQQETAEADKAGKMQFSAIMKARKSLAELAKMGELADINLIGAPYAIQFGLNANRSMRLLSEGENEEFIFFPTDFGIGRDDDESELSDVVAAGSDAATADGEAADAADGSPGCHRRIIFQGGRASRRPLYVPDDDLPVQVSVV